MKVLMINGSARKGNGVQIGDRVSGFMKNVRPDSEIETDANGKTFFD